MLVTALVFLLILSALVVIHELGHFLVAKFFGIKVEEFGFGFPPRAFGKKIGETLYSLNWLPIGGFVKLYGEDEAGGGRVSIKSQKTTNIDRAFFAKSPWQRAAVVVAGVIMNVFLASVIFYVYLFAVNFQVELPLLTNHTFFGVEQKITEGIIVDAVSKDSPAAKAGIVAPIRITGVNGQHVSDTKSFLAIVNENKGKEINLQLVNLQNNKETTAKLTPRVNPPKNEGSMGIRFYSFASAVLTYKTPTEKLFSGIVHPFNLMAYNYHILAKLVVDSFKEKTAAPLSGAVSGPVGIYSVVGNILEIPTLKERILQILNLAGLLSISLAFFNILPIPALDGGRLFFILIEAIIGKKVPQEVESRIHTVGMMILLGLFALITYQDIAKLFQ